MHASIQRLEEEKKRTVDAHLRYLIYADMAALLGWVPWHIDHEAGDPHPGRFSDDWYPISEVRTDATCCRTRPTCWRRTGSHTADRRSSTACSTPTGANRMTNADDARVVTMPANVRGLLQFGKRQLLSCPWPVEQPGQRPTFRPSPFITSSLITARPPVQVHRGRPDI